MSIHLFVKLLCIVNIWAYILVSLSLHTQIVSFNVLFIFFVKCIKHSNNFQGIILNPQVNQPVTSVVSHKVIRSFVFCFLLLCATAKWIQLLVIWDATPPYSCDVTVKHLIHETTVSRPFNNVIKGKHCPRYRSFVIPRTKANDTELCCFLSCVPEQTVKQTVEMPVVRDTAALIMASLYYKHLPSRFSDIIDQWHPMM